MIKILCDHCGDEVINRELHLFSGPHDNKTLDYSKRVAVHLGGNRKYDLCAKCYAELREFVKDSIEVTQE